ncbi:MAG: hypothetical protein J5696_07480 [Lachnospiraceae bacterium]|nr:hypothetical protein [Lachnospiraceae bacterium]
MICVDVDELVPCLINNQSGDIVKTEVIKVFRKSFLSKFNSKNGWYVNWRELSKECEIYALVVEGSVDVQGMIAMNPIKSEDMNAGFIEWAVAAPWNNPELITQKRYNGVGGHLIAMASEWAERNGYFNVVTGFCRNADIMAHFISALGANQIYTGLHPYHIVFEQSSAKKIREVYDYEWTDDEL